MSEIEKKIFIFFNFIPFSLFQFRRGPCAIKNKNTNKNGVKIVL